MTAHDLAYEVAHAHDAYEWADAPESAGGDTSSAIDALMDAAFADDLTLERLPPPAAVGSGAPALQ